ncbi:MAG: maltose alpha-D-glucosyltransferase [Polyangiaceae bacterium]|nr:maltose alpha-D-glucosyltransferase [Polyangiaceae bacterium]
MDWKSRRHPIRKPAALKPDPLWFKNAVIYEAHVRAFADSNGDGIGDLPGLTSRLDFLEDLGVTALWLLPFYPSPLRDGGYDIADYTNVHPSYGTLDDFKRFLDGAHHRGIRVITELVINHTSVDHAWFQRARRAPPGSPERDFYVWSDTPERYAKARIIFKDFETSNWAWDPVARAYYWHRFYSHQPDLNFDNLAVHDAVLRVLDFWFDMGVDGLRLDAVPYLYEREGTSCENLPETHAFLRKLRAHVDTKYMGRMLLAEANQWPADAASYFGNGDECHMNFHFPLMPRMFMAVQMEDSFPILDILRQTPTIPPTCQWATFLRNHDELTLEMVTDEDRDYMYTAYTEDPAARINLGIRRRLAPLLKSRSRIELMTAMLMTLPGTPVLYYGDEIGMGDNVYLGDRDGVRTPMQWSADRNAGFSRANPQKLYLPVIIDPEYHYEAVNVELQHESPASLLRWTKRLIALRKENPVLGHGDIELLQLDNPKILGFVRSHGDEHVVFVANLSSKPQFAELHVPQFAGRTPIELFGRVRFPSLTEAPYPLSFSPHAYFAFHLEGVGVGTQELPSITVADSWSMIVEERALLAKVLAAYATQRRWFRGKLRPQTGARVVDVLEGTGEYGRVLITLLEIDFAEGEPQLYMIPLGFRSGEAAQHLQHQVPHSIIASLSIEPGPRSSVPPSMSLPAPTEPQRGLLYDALVTGEAAKVFYGITRTAGTLTGEAARLEGVPYNALEEVLVAGEPTIRHTELEQTNSTVQLGDRALLKVFRQIEGGVNAEIEVGAFLADNAPSVKVPRILGSVTLRPDSGDAAAVAVLTEFVPHQGLAWDLFTHEIEGVFEAALSMEQQPLLAAPNPYDAVSLEPPEPILRLAAHHLRHARKLGERTAEIHLALASGTHPAFVPEPFTLMHQQSLFQRARGMLARSIELISKRKKELPHASRALYETLLHDQPRIEHALAEIIREPLDAVRARGHGDLHLGQVLFTGDDFVIIDFEGEPARPLRERRYKRSPLRDVAGMVRSFSYVAESSLRGGFQRVQDEARLRPWAEAWAAWTSAAYVDGYVTRLEGSVLVPKDIGTRSLLLRFYTLEKCVYEISYELNNRPEWLFIPVRGMMNLLPPPRV